MLSLRVNNPLHVDGVFLPLVVHVSHRRLMHFVRAEYPGPIGQVSALVLAGPDRVCVLKLCVV